MGAKWLEASVAGNGKITAAVVGAYSRESILINHIALKWRGYTGVLQDVSDAFPKIRKYYSEAKIFEAEKVLSGELEKRGYKPSCEQSLPLVMLNISFTNEGNITDYSRTTDMNSGEVRVEYKAGATHVSRGLFVSRSLDLIVYNASKSGQDKLNARLSLELPEGIPLTHSVIKYEGGMMYFANRAGNGLDYGLVARIVMAAGISENSATGISLKNSDSFSIFAKTFVNSSRDTEFKNAKVELMDIKASYEKMQSQNENAHRKLFEETNLELSSETKTDAAKNMELITAGLFDSDSIEQLWNFAKYLLIIGYDKLANSDINLITSLLYDGIARSVLPGNILELFGIFEKYADDLKKNAARIFGYKGYFIPRVSSPQSALPGSTDAGVLNFIAGGAIMANLFYSYYLSTGDIKTLKSRIFPFMREVFNFYSDFLKLDTSGYYSTIPSYSPDSTPGNVIQGKALADFKFATNSTIDFLAFSALLDNLCEAASAVGSDAEIAMWQDMKTKIPPFAIGDNGALKEYTNSAFIDSAYNCGCMHTYGLWPLKNFSFSDEPVQYRAAVSGALPSTTTLKKASSNAVITRLNRAAELQSSAALAVCAIQLAHAGEGGAVRNVLLRLVASSFTRSGLCLTNDWRGSGWTKSGKVELETAGNLGFATAITECIIQSSSRALKILPAPFPELSAGKIEGISTDFASRVGLLWDIKKNKFSVKISPKISCKIDIIIPKGFARPKLKDIEFIAETGTIKNFALTAGKSVTLDF